MTSKVKRKIGLVVVWLLFVTLLVEGAGYVYFEVVKARPVGEYGYPFGLFAAHEDLDYLYTPGFHGKFIGGGYHDIEIAINEFGFRSPPFGPKGERERIIVVGDSVVFGSGVRVEDRFTERLHEIRRERGRDTEVYNLGVNSYSFGHYLTLADMKFLGLEPDMVVVGFTLNDIAPKEDAWPARRFGRLRGSSRGKPDWVRVMQKALDRTYAGRFVRELKAHAHMLFMNTGERTAYHTRWMRTVKDAWMKPGERERLAGEIDAFSGRMREQEVSFVFLLFPERNSVNNPGELGYPRQAIRSLLEERNMAFCDPADELARYGKSLDEFFLAEDSVHFTPKGHQLLAEHLETCLAKVGTRPD